MEVSLTTLILGNERQHLHTVESKSAQAGDPTDCIAMRQADLSEANVSLAT